MTDEQRETVRWSKDRDDVQRIDDLEANQERFFTTLLGSKRTDRQGKVLEDLDGSALRNEEEGMKHKLDFVYDKMANGGIRITLPAGAWAFLVTIVTGIFGLIVALVNNPPGT